MKNFCKYIFKLLLILVISAYSLDFLYTKVYENSKERNKVQSVINGSSKNFDAVILGSSRANNHLVTSEFLKKNIRAFNYGMSGASLNETALLLKLMVEKKWIIRNVILEVDLNVNSEGFSGGTQALFMPYFRNSIISDYYKSIDNYNTLYYIPFYRFIANESKIGLREVFFSIINKKSNYLQNDGFYPLNNIGKNMKSDLSGYTPKINKNYNYIKYVCTNNKINLIIITTPMCKNTINRNYFKSLKKMYPEIHNFENVVTNNKYFSSCGHLNQEGARLFTIEVINNLLKLNEL